MLILLSLPWPGDERVTVYSKNTFNGNILNKFNETTYDLKWTDMTTNNELFKKVDLLKRFKFLRIFAELYDQFSAMDTGNCMLRLLLSYSPTSSEVKIGKLH